MLKQASFVSSVVLFVFAGQTALAGPVLDIDPGLMGIPRGGIVVSQLPDLGGGQASDTSFVNGAGDPYWQLLADNIQLSQSATIRHITWWGFYGGDFDKTPGAHDPPVGDETMRIRLYSARVGDGLPDNSNILFQQSFLNPSRAATGRTLLLPGIPAEYRFEVNLGSPLNLDSSVLYWLEISQEGNLDSHFRWQRGLGTLIGRASNNPITPNWQAISGSMAFELSMIPEPGTVSVLLICALIPHRWLGHGGRRVVRQ